MENPAAVVGDIVARNEFANMPFARTEKAKQQKKDTVMKMKSKVISVISAVTQSKWMRPALMTLALLATMLVVTGCPSSSDSGNHNNNHGNDGNHMNHRN